ncbi:MAG: preprotein translocase subunit SecA [Planctomycetes bacterium]|jgi:preprotein translocase subunit SecA|nr:preprotein translocase subunit SecA [Planctomycetota bacterium]
MVDWSNLGDRLGDFGENLGSRLKSFFGSRNERMVRTFEPLVARILELEPWAEGLSNEQFLEQTATWKKAIQDEETTLDELMPEAFALVREASKRTLGLRPYDVQMVGGMVLHAGTIAEMYTGEGKTLVATLPLYLNALTGKPVYLITVNDYLAKRDCEWMAPIFSYLGLKCGAIQSTMPPRDRLPIYHGDVVYGTNSEFGFDYLRDNMKMRAEEQVQRHLYYGIVDEVDSILVDEARTPLIISGPAEYMPDKYKAADRVARALKRDEHFEVKEKERAVNLFEDGIEEAEKMLNIDSFYKPGNTDWPHYIENALRAHNLYEKDTEYVVERGEVVIVDEFTGRKMQGRRWSDGLHQAVETKENIAIKPENQTLATITYQNYFRLYDKLAGMTGTAITEAAEFHKIYNLDVVSIPSNVPVARQDHVDVVYRTEPEKWTAIVEEIAEVNERGQPILVGTVSVEHSEKLSGLLGGRGVKHEVLNAKNHAREAEIVALAGAKGSVTVSTNMAGRGTDIKLGGNFEFRLKQTLDKAGLVEGDPEHLEEVTPIRDGLRSECDEDEASVLELGGLYVLGTERHEARRIDNQLRGRSGRQGDVGTSRFYLSLQDKLMRRFYKDWVTNAMKRLGMEDGVPIESPMVTRAIERAQRKVEEYNFEIRKSLLEYDEVMDLQRKTIYGVRQEVLEDVDLREKVTSMLGNIVRRQAAIFEGDEDGFREWFHKSFGFELEKDKARVATIEREGNPQEAVDAVLARYDKREKEMGEDLQRKVDRHLLLHAIDTKWMDHLRAIDALRQGIGLRGYGQKDPKNEYKAEGAKLFDKLFEVIEEEVTSLSLRVQVRAPGEGGSEGTEGPWGSAATTTPYGNAASGRAPTPQELEKAQALMRARQATRRAPASAAFDSARRQKSPAATKDVPVAEPAISAGRNEPCPCGSGRKYKKCHGKG